LNESTGWGTLVCSDCLGVKKNKRSDRCWCCEALRRSRKPVSPETREKMRQAHLGSLNPRWKRGGYISSNGYVFVLDTETGKDVMRSRMIAESALGRPLKMGEVVHHINRDRADDRNANLLICSRSYHKGIHVRMKKRAENKS